MTAIPLDTVLSRMSAIIADERAAASPLGYFPCLYRGVTLRVRVGVAAGRFDDGPRMERFVGCFAALYLEAYDAHRAGGVPPSAWAVAFDAGTREDLIALQHLLLGMNAHINRDLAVAAVEVAGGAAGLPALAADFDRINDVLGELTPMTKTAIERFSPLLDVLDRLGGDDDDAVLGFSLAAARHDAWIDAQVLAAQPGALAGLTMAVIEKKAALLGRIVAGPAGPAAKAVEIIRASESTDVRAIIDALAALG